MSAWICCLKCTDLDIWAIGLDSQFGSQYNDNDVTAASVCNPQLAWPAFGFG